MTALRDSILIFGASGLVGSALTRVLAERGEKVIAVSRRPLSLKMKNVEVVTGELSRVDHFLPLLTRSRIVVHTASCSIPGCSTGRPLEELQHNLHPLLAMLQALQCQPQTKLLYLSWGPVFTPPILVKWRTKTLQFTPAPITARIKSPRAFHRRMVQLV